MTYELGMGRIAFANNDLDTARKNFQKALDYGSGVGSWPNWDRRGAFAAARGLGDVTLRLGKYSDAATIQRSQQVCGR
jgi:hypothetical protein